jgi:hypothetical protein
MPACGQHHQPIVVVADHENMGQKWGRATQPHGSKRIVRSKLTLIQIWDPGRVSQWLDLHFYRAPGQRVNLILVARMKPMSNGQPFPPLWLAWVGERTLPKRNSLVQIFTTQREWIIGIGLLSQRLHWTLPNLRTPEQSERWSDLMPPRSWQLWLARDLVVENVLLQAICYD